MVDKITRRKFIKYLAAGLGSAAAGRLLAACGQPPTPGPLPTAVPPTITPLPAATATHAPTATAEPEPTATPTPTSLSPPGTPDLFVVRGGAPEDLVMTALAAYGGIEQFVQPGYDVVIKPNMCVALPFDFAATTNPWVVGTLVRLCLAAGAGRVQVMDHGFGAGDTYGESGIQEQVELAGGVMKPIDFRDFVEVELPHAEKLHSAKISQDILNADLVINVPIAKHHHTSRLTLGMKNLIGTLWDMDPTMHGGGDLHQHIADLFGFIRPALTVMDAVRILMANGPQGFGPVDTKRMDMVIVGVDTVAIDAYATQFFTLRPEHIRHIQHGVRMGLGRSDLENLWIEEIEL